MIDAQRNVLVLSEHAGGTPAWYTPGYGIFQDTPYTFATPDQFSCAVNRGPADAPLFQINHWITNTKPPSVEEAKAVNAYDALLGLGPALPDRAGPLPHDPRGELRHHRRPAAGGRHAQRRRLTGTVATRGLQGQGPHPIG